MAAKKTTVKKAAKKKRGRPPISAAGPTRTVALIVNPEIDDSIRAISEEEDRTWAAVAREILRLGLEAHRGGSRSLAKTTRRRKA